MNLATLLVANIVLLAILGIGIGVCLHKIRRVHLLSYEISESSKQARNEATALFDQLQALMSLSDMLKLPAPLPPMRGWAASPDFLLALAQEIRKNRPLNVLECSSGSSTVVAARCMQMQDRGHVYSLEHDATYADKTKALLAEQGLEKWATVILAPLEQDESGALWYSLSNLPAEVREIGLLVIDGPPAVSEPLARYPALLRLEARLSRDCAVLLDDANRPGEKEILSRWRLEFPEFEQEFIGCEKGAARLRRRNTRPPSAAQ